MLKIPLNANVICSNGAYGRSTYAVIDPKQQRMTHLVVKEAESPHTERLAPIEDVVESGSQSIRMACTKEEMARHEPFLETHYVEVVRPAYLMAPTILWPVLIENKVEHVPVKEEHIPANEVAVHRGVRVEATDGAVGKLSEFLVKENSGDITHLALEEGHLWNKREVVVPVSAVHYFAEETIHLNLDRHTIDTLPTAPAGHQFDLIEPERV